MEDFYNNRLRKHALAEKYLKEGLYPNQIAKEMKVKASTVLSYLQLRVGMGKILLSEIYFSWPDDKRKILLELENHSKPESLLKKHNLDSQELKYYHSIREKGIKLFNCPAPTNWTSLRVSIVS